MRGPCGTQEERSLRNGASGFSRESPRDLVEPVLVRQLPDDVNDLIEFFSLERASITDSQIRTELGTYAHLLVNHRAYRFLDDQKNSIMATTFDRIAVNDFAATFGNATGKGSSITLHLASLICRVQSSQASPSEAVSCQYPMNSLRMHSIFSLSKLVPLLLPNGDFL